MFIVTRIVSVIVLSFVVRYFYFHSSLAIISMGKRKLVALLSLSSCCFDGCVALPHGDMGLPAACDCGIS